MYSIPPEKKQQIKQIAQSGKMIEAIKEYRLLTNASLEVWGLAKNFNEG